MSEETPHERPLIAVLEDDSFQRTWFERLLERASFRVRSYADPRDFLTRRGERPLPDVLLLDIVLLDLDAFQVLAELEGDWHWCQVPVVLMTASATMDRILAVQRLALRPEGFLAKPVDIRSLLLLLRAICEGQDPALQLRRLKRQHRSEEIFIQSAIKEIGDLLRNDDENARKYGRLRVESLRRAQRLRLRAAVAGPVGAERDKLAEHIREADAAAERCRTKAVTDGPARRQNLAADLALHRQHLQELEEEISTLTMRIRLLGSNAPPTDSSAASAESPTDGEPEFERDAA